MTIVIVGAAGFVGKCLLDMLCDTSHRVVGIDCREFEDAEKNKNVEYIVNKNGNFQSTSVQNVLNKADLVIHLASRVLPGSSNEFEYQNVGLYVDFLEAISGNAKAKIIHVSSSVVISAAKDDYTRTKRLQEKLIKKYRTNFIILRPTIMFGPGDEKHFGNIARYMDSFPVLPIPSNGKYLRQPLYVKDFCKLILFFVVNYNQYCGQTFDLAGQNRVTFIEMLKAIRRQKKVQCYFIGVPLPVFSFSLKLATALFGFKKFSVDQLNAIALSEVFADQNWESEFQIWRTPFAQGVKETFTDDPNFL